jgi:hypothetical protein
MREKRSTKKNSAARVGRVPWRVVRVRALPRHRLSVSFADGTAGEVDVSRLVLGRNPGVFEALRDRAVFERVRVRNGAVTWPGQLDLAPDTMYDEIRVNGRYVVPA